MFASCQVLGHLGQKLIHDEDYYLPMLKVVDSDKSRLFAITEFKNCFVICLLIFLKIDWRLITLQACRTCVAHFCEELCWIWKLSQQVDGRKNASVLHWMLIGISLFIKTMSSILHDVGDTSPSKADLLFGIFADLKAKSCPVEIRTAGF